MLSQMGHIMVSVSDSVMVGRLGAVPLASVSLAVSVFSVVMLFGIGASYGMTPLVAQADGERDIEKSASILKHGGILNAILGILLTGVIFICASLLPYFGQNPDVLKGAIPYLEILAMTLIPLMIFQSFRQFTEGLSYTRQAMYISVSANILNVILNYVLIFGKFGIAPMGIIGAGYATLISRVCMALAMGLYVLLHSRFVEYQKFFKYIRLNKARFKEIINIGIPSGMQYTFEIGAFSTAAIMVGWTGAIPLAAHQIALNLSAITYMMATGIAAAATIRVGNQLGRKDFSTLRIAGITCFIMAGVFMAVNGLIFILGKDFLPMLYIEDQQVVTYAASLLVVAAFFQVSDGIQAVGLGVLRGLSDVKIPTYVTLFAFWIVAIPLSYILGIKLHMEAIGIWIGLSAGLTVAAILHVSRFLVLTKKLNQSTV